MKLFRRSVLCACLLSSSLGFGFHGEAYRLTALLVATVITQVDAQIGGVIVAPGPSLGLIGFALGVLANQKDAETDKPKPTQKQMEDAANAEANARNAQQSAVDKRQKAKERVSPKVNQLNEQVRKGQAPWEIERIDKGHVPTDIPHAHLKNGQAINCDATMHHGKSAQLTKKGKEWLEANGWDKIPKELTNGFPGQ